LTEGYSRFAGAACSALFHIEFALDGKYVIPSCLAVAPKAQVRACLPFPQHTTAPLDEVNASGYLCQS
jgi:hypothetical protein